MSKVNIRDYQQHCTDEGGWTKAFKQAAEDLRAAGGMIYVPAGEYLTCSIQLESHMELYLETGAILRFIQDKEQYELVETEFEGIMGTMYKPCIYVREAEQVTISGRGVLDGQGSYWWERQNSLPHARPYLVCFENCQNVRLEGVTLLNSPAWTVHPVYCDNVVIDGITIKNPANSPNTDGIDPDCSRNVRISNCYIDVGDDCIAIKAGTEDTDRRMPCENITITNCNMIHGHGGIVIGSEMSGSVRNVTVSNCVFQDTDRGIRLKTRRKRGGTMERLLFQNIIMERVICPLTFNMYYFCGKNGKEKYVWDKQAYPLDETTPAIRNIQIQNLMVEGAQAAAGFFYGLPEQPIENVKIANCSIRMNPAGPARHPAMLSQMEPMMARGFYLRHVKNLVISNTEVLGYEGELADKDETVDCKWI